jgi:23S rRNA (cytosine1962-C5)-methyltransferase
VQIRSATNHPFIFERMVARTDPAAQPGDIVTVYGRDGGFFGRALFNPRSRIVLRLLTHTGMPIDDAFWSERLRQGVELRRQLRLDDHTDAYRLLHAEGDQLSGLIAERYADCLVFEFFSLGMFQRREALARALADLLGPPSSLDRPHQDATDWHFVYRADESIARIEGIELPPADERARQSVIIREHGVRYKVDLATGHKTGFFCDQRENRRRFAELCTDADVLDVCCYSGGFGLCAHQLGGARSVTGVDLDEAAIALAKENANLNQARLEFVHADAFGYLRQMIDNARRYDTVVLDPPKFVPTRRDLDEGLRKYQDLNALGLQVVRPGGYLLTCSCSGLVSEEQLTTALQRGARSLGRSLQRIASSGAGADHPVMLNCPESAYLKALWFRVW